VRKLDDQRAEEGGKRLTISLVYESIKRSNSSLKRRSKKLLEDSIDRVLRVLDEERDDSDSVEGDFEGLEEQEVKVVKEHNIVNRSITKAWGKPATMIPKDGVITSGTTTPGIPSTLGPILSTENGVEESPAKAERLPNGEPKLKRRKGVEREKKEESRAPPKTSDVSYRHLAGIPKVIKQLRKIGRVFAVPELYIGSEEGGEPTRGVLLYGPPGCGKTCVCFHQNFTILMLSSQVAMY